MSSASAVLCNCTTETSWREGSAADLTMQEASQTGQLQATKKNPLGHNTLRSGPLTVIYSRKLTKNDRKLSAAYEALREIRELPDDWDYDGAPSFSERLLTAARQVLSDLPYAPFVMPTACPSIQMNFRDADAGYYLQLDMFEDGTAESYCEDPTGQVSEGTMSWDELPNAVRTILDAIL